MKSHRFKSRVFFIMGLLLSIMIIGCEDANNTSIADVNLTVAPTGDPSIILEPTLFSSPEIFFENIPEYSRLYRISDDKVKLELDEQVNFVEQANERVVYSGSSKPGIWSFDQRTGEHRQLIDLEYYYVHLGGNYLYYSVVTWDDAIEEKTQLFALHLPTDETRLIGCCNSSDFIVLDENVYFLRDVGDVEKELVRYDPSVDEIAVIVFDEHITDLHGYGSFFFYNTGDCWMLYDAESEKSKPIPELDPKIYDLIYADENCIIYCEQFGGSRKNLYLQKEGEKIRMGNYSNAQVAAYTDGYLLFEARMTMYADTICYLMFSPRFCEYSVIDTTGQIGNMFANGDFPRIDTSTARIPIADSLYNLFVSRQGYEGVNPISSKTHGAWLNIADRTVDFALLVKPTMEEEVYLAEKNIIVEMKPYGADSLVFIGNPTLPIESLTANQIRKIYSGQLTNWKEIGGPDHNIEVYYRNDQSGSQRLFESLVWNGHEIPSFSGLGFTMLDDMMDIVNICGDNPYAIGYTLSTYIGQYSQQQLRRFAVDGISPTEENLINGLYPFATVGYVIIRADESENSPARRLYNWFGCSISEEIINESGMIPLK